MRGWGLSVQIWLLAATLVAVAGSATFHVVVEPAAAHDAILLRRKIMKAVGNAAKEASEMAKGQRAFDAKRAASHMSLVAHSWEELAKLFPAGSESGARTRAAPEVWTNFADFEAQGSRMSADAIKAGAAAAEGADAFARAFEPVAASCKECHKTYMTRD